MTRLILFFKKIINLGVGPSQTVPERQRVKLANTLTLAPLAVYLFFFVIGMINKIDNLLLILIIFSIINLSGLFFSWQKQVALARAVPLISNSVLIFLAADIYDFGSQLPLFYFSLLAAYALYFDYKKEAYMVVPAFLVTITTIALNLILPQHSLFKITTSPELVAFTGLSVKIFSFILFLFFLFLLNRFSFLTESTLLKLLKESKQQGKDLEEARKKSEIAVQAKTRFLSNMSHELRTPLNGIVGSTTLMLQEKILPEQQEHLDVLKYSSEHMLRLVNDILDFNKIETGNLEVDKKTGNLVESLETVISFFKPQFEQKGLILELQADSRLDKELLFDETRLNQVLTNLIGNALKFTPQGKVTVTITELYNSDEDFEVYFSVKDTGIGIPPERQAQIFESFEQVHTGANRRFGGAGLGLSISRKIVELMGGELKVKSKPGEGSQFSFIIKIFSRQTRQQDIVINKTEENITSLKGVKVLIAEDNPINMIVAKKFLEKWEAHVTQAVNGKELLNCYAKDKFDILLIDLEMPGIDGYEALKRIREHDTTTPAIAFTASVFENMQTILIEKGFTAYLPKPFRQNDLYDSIKKHLP